MAGAKPVRPAGKSSKNYCFGCGPDNDAGLRLKFHYDEARNCFLSRFRIARRFTGPPGHVHGGIIATILDEAMGKVNRLWQVTAMTREMTIEYLKPTPLNQWLTAEGRELRVRGRVHFNVGELRDDKGTVLARSRGTFIAIDPHQMFGHRLSPAERQLGFMESAARSAQTGAAGKARAKSGHAK